MPAKSLSRHIKLLGVITAVVTAIIIGVFAWTAYAPEDLLVSSDQSAVPSVTDTEAFFAYLRGALAVSDPLAVQSQLKEVYADTSYGEQHMSLHYFGEVLYEVEGASALPLCTDWYGYGCYHGFLLVAIDTEGYEVVPSLDAACVERHGHTMETETCQHGIGHGLLEFSGRDPFEAIEACGLVADVYAKLGCASGVFMEYFAPTESEARTLVTHPEFDAADPLNVCDQFAGLRQATCLFEIQSWWEEIGKVSPRAVETLCNSVEDSNAREFCLIGYGNYKGPYVENALPYCDQFVDPESHALCRAGVLWAAEHHYDAKEPQRACSDLEGEYKDMCFEKGRFTCEVERRCAISER